MSSLLSKLKNSLKNKIKKLRVTADLTYASLSHGGNFNDLNKLLYFYFTRNCWFMRVTHLCTINKLFLFLIFTTFLGIHFFDDVGLTVREKKA